MKASKKLLASAVALVMATVLSACGKEEPVSSVHDYTYVTLTGDEYSGTYTGGWENSQPNGEGSFSGEGERGSLSLVGNWSNGQPNGQCRRILRADTYIQTYSGDYFYNEWKGNGTLKVEDLDGNLTSSYTGEFRDGKYNGNGEATYYYTDEQAAEQGFERRVYKGQFADGNWNGEAELTIYYTAENAAQDGEERRVYKGNFSEGALAGEATLTIYYTSEYVEAYGIDCEVRAGQCKDGKFVEPFRYAFYKDGKVVEEGRVRDGKRVSDAEKEFNDSIYDGLQDLLGDGFLGDVFDFIAPSFYDRNAE